MKRVLAIDKEGGEGLKGDNKNFSKAQRKIFSTLLEKNSRTDFMVGLKDLSLSLKVVKRSWSNLLLLLCLSMQCHCLNCPKTSVINWRLQLENSGGVTVFRRKIPWVSWDKLCRSKESGGLGVHDIGRFNQALLGKQAWFIFSQPSSLMARVLKIRYFKNSSFLEAAMGSCPSYMWSILHGREALKLGLLRKIGDGVQSNVWTSHWLLTDSARPPMYRQESIVDLTLKVNDLLLLILTSGTPLKFTMLSQPKTLLTILPLNLTGVFKTQMSGVLPNMVSTPRKAHIVCCPIYMK